MKPKVLVIAKKSLKAEALIRYWPEDEWDLQLYTYRRKEWFPGMSDRLGENWVTHVPAGANGSSPAISERRREKQVLKRIYRQKSRGMRKLIHHKLWRLYDQQMLKWALPTVGQTREIARRTRPDMVLSIYEPLAANLIARRIATFQGVPWIAYFRDHCTTYNELFRVPLLWYLQSRYDIRLHAPMHSLVGVSHPFVDILRKFYNHPAADSHVVTGGFEDHDLPAEMRSRCLDRRKSGRLPAAENLQQPHTLLISYVGAIYGHRLEPLEILLDSMPILASQGIPCKLQLILSKAAQLLPWRIQKKIGTLQDEGLIAEFGTERIPHSQALKMLDAADVNLILEGMRPPHSTAGTITWKIFELMMVAKPAVAICAPSLPIGAYLQQTGIGIDCHDIQGTAARLQELWQWKQGNQTPHWYAPAEESIAQYSFQGMADKMNAVLEQTYEAAQPPSRRDLV
jgi:hypothetical protein